MLLSQVFPLLVGVMEFGAGAVYLYQRQYRDAIVWFAYSVAAGALAWKH
jgi:hypothetical protein